jgi:hypothetical protein
MYVINIHRLLNDLHHRYATLGRRRPNTTNQNDEMGLSDNMADDGNDNGDDGKRSSAPNTPSSHATSTTTGGPNLGGASVRAVLKVPTAAPITPSTTGASSSGGVTRRDDKQSTQLQQRGGAPVVVTREATQARLIAGAGNDKKEVSELGPLAGLLSIMFDWGAEASIDKVLTVISHSFIFIFTSHRLSE